MFSMNGSGKTGARMLLVSVATLMIAGTYPAAAETVMTINGKAMDSAIVDAYITGRVKKPLDQVTAEERAMLVDELADIYVLSTTDAAAKIEKDPATIAQIELQKMGILARGVVSQLVSDIEINEDEIQATYQEQIKLAPNKQYKASHILVETQAEALDIINSLLAGGNFEEIAKEKSKGPSAADGGSLGDWFSPDQMVKPFSDAVINLADGRYTTDPVHTKFGWHVIRRDATRPAAPPPLESVRENIKAKLQSDKLRVKIDEMKAKAIKH